ncbi:PAS domain-containing sensor histidine kinase [Desulfocurvibacter africanus]|uniref:PAS domain-containing sensor histidine kinase n=1 Tax=Desulfocurvibacter africanus TaxID=873 RepID=UPI000427F254|nr:PAS domain-containing sensor histidine kinase [Desulfocurvibacter africanus]
MDRTKKSSAGAMARKTLRSGAASPASPFDDVASSLLDAMPFMVLILDSERRIVHTNASALRFLDIMNPEDVRGMLAGEAFDCARLGESDIPCGSSDACQLCGAHQALTACQKGLGGVRECRLTTRQGGLHRTLDLMIWTSPLRIKGQPYSMLSFRDVSRENRARMLERIFFHDVANTLSGIQNLVGLIVDDGGTIAPEDLTLLCTAVEHLSEEITSQRDLAAAERGELVVRSARISSREILAWLRESYSLRNAARGKTLAVDDSAAEVTFESDPVLLKRVLGNMILNALEASEPGQTVTLGCHLCMDGQFAGPIFWVHDPEPLPPDIATQLFQHSFSTKGEGRGLGTYSLKLLGEGYLGGTVSFDSAPDKGTTFRIALPLRPEPKEASL